MKKFLILLLLASPVQADMRHSITTSAKVTLDAAYSSANRIGTTYSVTGNNVTPSTTVSGTTTSGAIGGLTADSVTSGVPAIVDTCEKCRSLAPPGSKTIATTRTATKFNGLLSLVSCFQIQNNG